MEQHPSKIDIFNSCLVTLEHREREASKAMAEAQQAANDYGTPRDRYDSFRAQVLSRRDMYARQYHEALKQRDILTKIDPLVRCSRVEFGALVLTNAQLLFVSVGLGKLKCQSSDFYAISPLVPLYEAIKGRAEGGVFRFRGEEYVVLSVV